MIAINETLRLLPPEAKQEVMDFVEFISQKYLKKKAKSRKSRVGYHEKEVMNFAGSWKDMGESDFQGLISDIYERRKHSFSRRREI